MKLLSLHEKISIKGELIKKNINVPKLRTTKEAVHYWNFISGKSILKFLNPLRYKSIRKEMR